MIFLVDVYLYMVVLLENKVMLVRFWMLCWCRWLIVIWMLCSEILVLSNCLMILRIKMFLNEYSCWLLDFVVLWIDGIINDVCV